MKHTASESGRYQHELVMAFLPAPPSSPFLPAPPSSPFLPAPPSSPCLPAPSPPPPPIRADVAFSIDDFNAVGDRVPLLANLKPHGKYHMADLDAIGGLPVSPPN